MTTRRRGRALSFFSSQSLQFDPRRLGEQQVAARNAVDGHRVDLSADVTPDRNDLSGSSVRKSASGNRPPACPSRSRAYPGSYWERARSRICWSPLQQDRRLPVIEQLGRSIVADHADHQSVRSPQHHLDGVTDVQRLAARLTQPAGCAPGTRIYRRAEFSPSGDRGACLLADRRLLPDWPRMPPGQSAKSRRSSLRHPVRQGSRPSSVLFVPTFRISHCAVAGDTLVWITTPGQSASPHRAYVE